MSWTYVHRKCIHHLNLGTNEWQCTDGKTLCQTHGKHLPCPYTHKNKR